jgi:monoamine oxidase
VPLQEELARPVQDTLFFAGEAVHVDGFAGTVHGALETGERAAREVLRSLKHS